MSYTVTLSFTNHNYKEQEYSEDNLLFCVKNLEIPIFWLMCLENKDFDFSQAKNFTDLISCFTIIKPLIHCQQTFTRNIQTLKNKLQDIDVTPISEYWLSAINRGVFLIFNLEDMFCLEIESLLHEEEENDENLLTDESSSFIKKLTIAKNYVNKMLNIEQLLQFKTKSILELSDIEIKEIFKEFDFSFPPTPIYFWDNKSLQNRINNTNDSYKKLDLDYEKVIINNYNDFQSLITFLVGNTSNKVEQNFLCINDYIALYEGPYTYTVLKRNITKEILQKHLQNKMQDQYELTISSIKKQYRLQQFLLLIKMLLLTTFVLFVSVKILSSMIKF